MTVSAAASGSSVTIMGAGQSITGNGNRVFFIDPGANVTLQNVTITGGSGVTEGGGVYASGASIVTIIDSVLSNNSASAQGTNSQAMGGGLYVAGSSWTLTLTGDTLSGNNVYAGQAGTAEGGAAYFSAGGGSCRLTILNNLAAPIADPSIMINNYDHAGADGIGGYADGGALYLGGVSGASLTANIGNTAFYGNLANGGNGGTADGGGVYLGFGNVTMVNCTVAENTAGIDTSGSGGTTSGGGVYLADTGAVTLDNNTIHANTINAESGSGSAVFIASGNPTLINNIVHGNSSPNSSAPNLDTNGITLSNATNNTFGSISPNAVNEADNFFPPVGQGEFGSVVGVTANGQPSGGPIYYPLLPGLVSVGGGTTSVVSTIAAVEGTDATDETGNFLPTSGPIDIGAVQVVLPSPPAPPQSPPAPPHSLPQSPPPAPPQSSPALQAIVNELESFLASLEAEINVLLGIILKDLR